MYLSCGLANDFDLKANFKYQFISFVIHLVLILPSVYI
ncbi:hypothetical protein P20495_3682 [Pseudoalteromonas sp. BSi20495]|nr:hypothetical protein P20495_3682 [Pseudoalteromonas sp. BSi20495]